MCCTRKCPSSWQSNALARSAAIRRFAGCFYPASWITRFCARGRGPQEYMYVHGALTFSVRRMEVSGCPCSTSQSASPGAGEACVSLYPLHSASDSRPSVSLYLCVCVCIQTSPKFNSWLPPFGGSHTAHGTRACLYVHVYNACDLMPSQQYPQTSRQGFGSGE